jgi:hypothetical protein
MHDPSDSVKPRPEDFLTTQSLRELTRGPQCDAELSLREMMDRERAALRGPALTPAGRRPDTARQVLKDLAADLRRQAQARVEEHARQAAGLFAGDSDLGGPSRPALLVIVRADSPTAHEIIRLARALASDET